MQTINNNILTKQLKYQNKNTILVCNHNHNFSLLLYFISLSIFSIFGLFHQLKHFIFYYCLLNPNSLTSNKNIKNVGYANYIIALIDLQIISISLNFIKNIIMGSCLESCFKSCCLSQIGTKCCSIISILGTIYFIFMWIIFDRQKNFFQFHLPDPSDTKLSCLISALIYLMFFIWTAYRLWKMNKQKKGVPQQNHRKSISQYHELKQLKDEQVKQVMMRED